MPLLIAAIVEGETEADCLPGLLRRIFAEAVEAPEPPIVLRPIVAPADSLRSREQFLREKVHDR